MLLQLAEAETGLVRERDALREQAEALARREQKVGRWMGGQEVTACSQRPLPCLHTAYGTAYRIWYRICDCDCDCWRASGARALSTPAAVAKQWHSWQSQH